ncbi:MAG: toxic anion resistance protein [Propionibacteriaceae bacterium]|jgi:uncharacterized protein YaaN involved in tellurite resistance|nr:toxic anion resistance protein [Propionibacteriaceae bacterium]
MSDSTTSPTPPVEPNEIPAAGGVAMAMEAPLLSLDAPAPMEAVVATQAPAMAPQVEAEQIPILDEKVSAFIAQIEKAETKSPELAAQADAVRAMGDVDIRKAAEASNRLLTTPVKAMKEGGLSQGSTVGKTLMDLRRTVEDLDPHQDKGFKKKLLGKIPMGRSVENYFRKYQSSQEHLNAILHALRSGQDELTRDNVSLGLEKQNLWQTMGRLNQYVYIAERLDEKLENQINELSVTDPDRAKVLSEDVLFYVRQKHQDLLTQLAVSIQNYLSIDIIVKNNIELIKGVDRASTTTVAALRTAVIVSQALSNQKLVLDQITALNTTTSAMIQKTSEMLKDQSATIQEQAANSTIGLAQLQQAFENIYATMDSIDTFKAQALTNMSQTITVLESEVTKSRVYLDRVQKEPQIQEASSLAVDNGA